MAKLTLSDISSGYLSGTTYTANNTAIETAVENTLSRDGTAPNQMGAVLDMNSYAINNLPDAVANQSPVTLAQAGTLLDITAATQASVGALLWPRTAAEISAAVTPTNYQYEPGNVLRYGTNTTPGTTDMTTAIQAALDSNTSVYVPKGTYACVGLTMDNGNNRVLYGDGISSSLTRLSNGDMLTLTDNSCQIRDIKFTSDGTMTGDNIVITNTANTSLLNVISQQSVGRCLKATGTYSSLKVIGGKYNLSSSAAGDAPPIVLGDSSNTVDSLYFTLQGVNFNENGAPLVIYRGSTGFISDCQLGGLSYLDGNGTESSGNTMRGCRVTGDMTIGGSSHVFVGNIVSSSIDVTFGTTCATCMWVANTNPNSITNSGNANNLIMREVGSGGISQLQFGDDTSAFVLDITHSSGRVEFPQNVVIPNNTSYIVDAADGSDAAKLTVTSGNNLSLSNSVTAKAMQFSQTGAGLMQFLVNGVESISIQSNVTVVTVDPVFKNMAALSA
jgi:hypothetical protein